MQNVKEKKLTYLKKYLVYLIQYKDFYLYSVELNSYKD